MKSWDPFSAFKYLVGSLDLHITMCILVFGEAFRKHYGDDGLEHTHAEQVQFDIKNHRC